MVVGCYVEIGVVVGLILVEPGTQHSGFHCLQSVERGSRFPDEHLTF